MVVGSGFGQRANTEECGLRLLFNKMPEEASITFNRFTAASLAVASLSERPGDQATNSMLQSLSKRRRMV